MSAATKRLRAAVFKRADNKCEACGCFIDEETGRLDHFFGRAKVPQAEANCWALCLECDTSKTVNQPSATYWLVAFLAHAVDHNFEAEAERAGAKLQTLQAKGRAA